MPQIIGPSHHERLSAALTEAFEQVWLPTPPFLYRYVPVARADDIQKGTLYASNITEHAQSDQFEFRLGWGLIRTAADVIAKHAGDDETLRELAQRIASDANPFEGDYFAYAVCLTTQPDAEHMWARFAKGGGARFAFRAEELVAGIRRHQESLFAPDSDGESGPGHAVRLLPVHYDSDELISAVETMIHKVVMPEVRRRKEHAPDLEAKTAASIPFYALRNVFVPMSLSFKRTRYADEREWRIVMTRYKSAKYEPEKGLRLKWADAEGKASPLPTVGGPVIQETSK